LKKYIVGVILNLLKKETGVNPVRARRRKARKTVFLPCAANKGHAIGKPRRRKTGVPQSEYFLSEVPLKRECRKNGKK